MLMENSFSHYATGQLSNCQHSNNERELEGTWVTLELQEAIRHGYTVTKYNEVWHWEQKEQYNKNTKTGGLFTDYVNTF
jgi:hypothetical protein